MSDTTVIGVADGVAAYVREVRAELADLPVEDVDDLTGGMEADLSELVAEFGADLVGRLGSPKLYAAELRSAAGLPDRVAGSGRGGRQPLSDAVAQARGSFTILTGQHPWLRSVTTFLVTLRPAWWLVRGYLAAWALWSLIMGMQGIWPHGVIQFTAAIAAIVASIRVGQGWLQERVLTRPLLALGNATAVVVALIASTSGVASGESNFYTATDNPTPGVSLNGQQVGNIYGYDSAGKRISDIRLFDQDGRPLGGGDVYDANGNPVGVVRDSSGAPLINVYPRALFGTDSWQITDPANPQTDQQVWTPPMSIVPLTARPTPTPTPTPRATATPKAKATPTTGTSKPVPSKSASVTPSGG